MHGWQIPVTVEKGWALAMIFQLKLKGIFWSFDSQIYLLRVVSSLLFSCLKDDLWPPYLSLNEFAVSPIYVSVLIRLMVSTDA